MLKHSLLSLAFIFLVPSTLRAAGVSFVGKWKLNPDKSTLHDQMKVTSAGANRYAFDFGGGNELIAADGTDQPGLDSTTLSVTPKAQRTWQVVRKKSGRMQISAIWNLSADGNTLRDDFTGYPSDGSTFTIHYVYTRTAGSAGFVGTWDSTSEKTGAAEMDIQPFKGDGLSFANSAEHSTKLMRFDGKDYPVQDQKASPGASSSARRVNARTLECTEKRAGKVVDTQHIQLSADGSTLTMTIQPASGRRPNVLVFDRQGRS